MTNTLEDYKDARETPPAQIKRWHLTGAGLESLHEVTIDLPPVRAGRAAGAA